MGWNGACCFPLGFLLDVPGGSILPHVCSLLAYSHTTTSLSPSRMNWYVACSRCAGAMPCRRASWQVMRPFRLSSHLRSASSVPGAAVLRVGSATGFCSLATTISVEAHPDRTPSKAGPLARQRSDRTCPSLGDDPAREPAAVHPRHTLAGVLPALGAAVHCGGRQRQVQHVGPEPPLRLGVGGSQPAVVGFGHRDHVLNVRFPSAGEVGRPVYGATSTGRPYTRPPHGGDDARLHSDQPRPQALQHRLLRTAGARGSRRRI